MRCLLARVVPSVLALAALVHASSAREEPKSTFAEVHARAVSGLVKDLESLAGWCGDKELFAERDRAWRAILEVEPENLAARKGLRYSKKPDGTWVEPAPREIKNFNPGALPELRKRRQKTVEPFATAMHAALVEYACDDATKNLVYHEILGADPDDEKVHGLLGEVRAGELWLLEETLTGRERRGELKTLVGRALDPGQKLRVTELSGLEQTFGIVFPQHVESAHVRVLGTGDRTESETTARACEAVGDVLRASFAISTEHEPGYTIYLLQNANESGPVLDKLPGIAPNFREFLRKVVGAKIPMQPYVVYWDKDPKRRIDGAVRQTIGNFLDRGFGVGLEAGWAWEGIGQYLTRELVGTRLTWFVQSDGAAKSDALKSKLSRSDADWLAEALDLLQKPEHPSFAVSIDREVNAMTTTDALYAYALAAYFVEGRAHDGAAILERIGHGVGAGREKTSAAIKAVLHLDAAGLEVRLVRWLRERS